MTAVPLRLIDDIGMRKLTSAAAKLMEDHLTHYAVRNILKFTVFSKTATETADATRSFEELPVPLSREEAQHPASRREVLGWALQRDAPVHPP